MPLSQFKFISRRRLLLVMLSISMIVGAIFYNSVAIANRPVIEPKAVAVKPPLVSVLDVSPSFHTVVLSGHAQATPKYQLALTSQVSGQVVKLAKGFKSGQRFAKNDVLAWVDPISYQQTLASAKYAVEQAKVAILKEQRQLKVVERDRGRALSQQTKSSLIYRTPQLKAATARLENAKQQVKIAQRDLANTQITTPFDAMVITRNITPGQFVQQGQQVAMLYDASALEFKVYLPLSQWGLLNQHFTSDEVIEVSIVGQQGNRWQGQLDRVEKHIDSANQQRAVVVRVDAPLNRVPQLLAGMFARVELSLQAQQPLLAVPAKSLSADGQLWYVNDQQQLMAFNAEVVFQREGLVYIKPPHQLRDAKLQNYQVVATPLPNYVVKQTVQAIAAQS